MFNLFVAFISDFVEFFISVGLRQVAGGRRTLIVSPKIIKKQTHTYLSLLNAAGKKQKNK
jgi:hypothetical protein